MSTPGGGFSLGLTGNTNTSNLGAGFTANPSTQPSGFGGFSLTSAPTTTTSGFSSPATAAVTSTSIPTLNFNVNPSASSTPVTISISTTFNASLPTSNAAKHVSFSLPSSSTTSTSTTKASTLSLTNPITSTPVTTTSSTDTTNKPINYVQLNDLTQKWIADFSDLQKMLINQTSEIVNRDVILTANHDKIEKFVESIRNLKGEMTQVDQQLDFILSQQKDLEECLSSMEDEVSSYFPELPADDMYKLAENIDSRLKKTLETSKEIITKINDKNRSSENITNPMVAIGRILNHHTNSIHMLENSTTEAQAKLNDLLKLYQQYA